MLVTAGCDVDPEQDNDFSTEGDLKRLTCHYHNLSERFLRITKDFSKQYAHIYAARLTAMQAILQKRVKLKWGDKYPIKKLFELKEGVEDTCVVIGTLFKHQDLKPSILKELSEELQLVPQPKRTNFVNESDKLILEDELQRIRLVGDVIDIHRVVTGVVCAVLGYEEFNGTFKMIDCCWADSGPQKPLASFEDDRFVVFASGLNFSSAKDNSFAIQLMAEWLCGLVGGRKQRGDVSKIVRLIIAGNSVSGLLSDSANCGTIINTVSSNFSGPEFDSVNALKKLDETLFHVCNSIFVDLMPGEFDPTNIMLPQNPMHYCMFPKAVQMNSFNGVTNPYECELEGRVICGTSGQPIADVLQYSTIPTKLEALKATLKWGHMAPTAPDTLPCTPTESLDPFIIQNYPDVYFTGNAEKFDTDIYEDSEGNKTRLICVPSFAATRTIAIVNLKNLECFPMTFVTDGSDISDS
ncbi:DNA polymerase delta subunit 2 [Arctopsyche grandis]|uniref:DNA polymerase delta subunit 2 n=1 Tax=Arctopsyche grandis TaxID=121162 RepID=UPI00406D8060